MKDLPRYMVDHFHDENGKAFFIMSPIITICAFISLLFYYVSHYYYLCIYFIIVIVESVQQTTDTNNCRKPICRNISALILR